MTVRVLGVGELADAAALLGAGGVLAIPTDTVYGLAADLDDARAIRSMAALKARPTDVPIAVLCATVESARSVAATWPDAAAALASRFWPGPLTVVVPADVGLAARVGSSGTVGLRVPRLAVCLELLARTGPLAVTSANRHGEAPATTVVEVLDAFGSTSLAAALDGGRRDGAVSTVVRVDAEGPVVLREGAIKAVEVRAAISEA